MVIKAQAADLDTKGFGPTMMKPYRGGFGTAERVPRSSVRTLLSFK
jgi:hypothetical protein